MRAHAERSEPAAGRGATLARAVAVLALVAMMFAHTLAAPARADAATAGAAGEAAPADSATGDTLRRVVAMPEVVVSTTRSGARRSWETE